MEHKIRLAKKIAENSVISRREAERLIEAGLVTVDGAIILTPVFFVTDDNVIQIDGKSLQLQKKPTIIWKFHKPKGVITSKRDPKHRKTVFDFFQNISDRLLYIGRLDFNTEGLLLFTNNGDLSRKLELPSTGLKRVYRARVFGKLTDQKLLKLKSGIRIDGVNYGSIDVKVDGDYNSGIADDFFECSTKGSTNKIFDRPNGANTWVRISLSEGKNREIRRVLEAVDCQVTRLIRISYGPFSLGNILPGTSVMADESEMSALKMEVDRIQAQGKCRKSS